MTQAAATLQAENEALRAQLSTHTDSSTVRTTGYYVAAIVVLSFLGVAGSVVIVVFRPEKDYTATISILLGFLVPLVTALLAAAVHQVATQVDGRLTQLLQLTAKSSRAEGVAAEKAADAPAAAPIHQVEIVSSDKP